MVRNPALKEVFQRPEQMLRIYTKHCRAQAPAIVERDNETIRIFIFQPVDEMDFRPDGPFRFDRRLGNGFNDLFGGTDLIRKLCHLKAAFRMSNDPDTRIARTDLPDVLR